MRTFTCTHNSEHKRTESVPALGHSYESKVVPPTLQAGGYTLHTCTRCGDSYKTDETAALSETDEVPTPPETDRNPVPSETDEVPALPKSIASATVTGLDTKTYTGASLAPKPVVEHSGKVLSLGTDYTIAYRDSQDASVEATDVVAAGTYEVVIMGKGSYSGTVSLPFTIEKANASGLSIAKVAKKTYSGHAFRPKPTVKFKGKKLVRGADYTLSYKRNVKPGTAAIVVKGKGNFTGSKKIAFSIRKTPAAKFTVAKVKPQRYTGKAVKPKPTVKFKGKKLKRGADYTLSYKRNVKPGTAAVVVKGKGNFTGTKTVQFTIRKR